MLPPNSPTAPLHLTDAERPALIVGVGASAGGLQAVQSLLAPHAVDARVAYVVILHLDPHGTSHLPELLARVTELPVTPATDGEMLVADHVYVLGPAAAISIRGGRLVVRPRAPSRGAATTIDDFFRSLAHEAGARAAAVVLSGAGSDGSAGLRAIHEAGGFCLAQDPTTAEYDSMPQRAIDTGVLDAVLAPGRIAAALARRARARPARSLDEDIEDLDALEAILDHVARARGLDFGTYKKGTLWRRTRRRMRLRGANDLREYLERVRDDPEEASALYGDLLIGVTRFFRDPATWDHLQCEVLPQILGERPEGAPPVRAWVPACASGEEAYTVAIVLAEALEAAGQPVEMQILATDVDARSIDIARRGLYPVAALAEVPPARRDRFFTRRGDDFHVAKELRAAITFSVHDLLTDPPFARLDLITCRNFLIYLEPEGQQRALEVFHFGLRPAGILLLGGAETIGRNAEMFETVSKKLRVYRRTGPDRLPRFAAASRVSHDDRDRDPAPPAQVAAALRPGQTLERLVRDFVLRRFTSACAVVSHEFEVLYLFGPTERYLVQPVGELRTGVLAWARPGLYPMLRAALCEARERGKPVTKAGIRIDREAGPASVQVTVEPLLTHLPAMGLLVVAFADVAGMHAPPDDDGNEDGSLARQLERELRATRAEFESALAQLQSVDEEHRASHEELLSLNEELQSSNEELETSKEELQSLNEEITTVNTQLEERNLALRETNDDLQNFLSSVDVPVLLADRELRIRRYNPAVANVLRIVPSDVGRSLAHIKPRFIDTRLVDDASDVLERLRPITSEIETDDGQWYARRIVPYLGPDNEVAGVCVTFNEVTLQKRAALEVEDARAFSEAIVETVPQPVIVVDADLRVVSANRSFYVSFGGSSSETEGRLLYALRDGEWDIPALRRLLEEVLPERREVTGFVIEHVFPGAGPRRLVVHARELDRAAGPRLILIAVEDVTAYTEVELEIRRQARALLDEHRRKDEFLAMLGHELRNPLAAIRHATQLLALSPEEPSNVARLADALSRHTARITALVDQLLEVSRVISGKIELHRRPVDIATVVGDAIDAVGPIVAAQSQHLEMILPAATSRVFVLGDRYRLVQVLENLLTNATKYTPTGGRIVVSVTATSREAVIRVRDDGVGIDAELLPTVFDLFTQERRSMDRAQGGLGLGLSLAKRLVEMHGGQLSAASAGPGQGSEFTITMPRAPTPAPGTAESGPDRPGEAAPPSPHRILIVDDEEDAARMLAEILEMQGHTTVAVGTGEAALERARTMDPDVVLLDLGLPHMDGYEVARRLREEHGDQLMLVALTGYQSDPDRLVQAGFDRHLLKPADLEKLSRWLARRRGPDEIA